MTSYLTLGTRMPQHIRNATNFTKVIYTILDSKRILSNDFINLYVVRKTLF